MKKTFSIFACLLFLVAGVANAQIERHALVIGNSDYASTPLVNPSNDATDVAAELSRLGYQLHRGKALLNLDLATFENELREFAFSLPNSAVAVVYYAGHGVATEVDNYLIPLGSRLVYQEQLKTRAVSLRDTVALLGDRNSDGLNVVLLDACRNSPLEKQFGRNLSQGLNRIGNLARGSFIGYAADEGQIAADGKGRNGAYTGELLTALRDFPGMPIQLLHNRVAQRVFEKTENTEYPQLPVSEQKFIGDYCIGPCQSELVGSFAVELTPPETSVCFYAENWLCGVNAKLPLGREYPVYATAEGYPTFEGRARLDEDGQVLKLNLGSENPLQVTAPAKITQPVEQKELLLAQSPTTASDDPVKAKAVPKIAYIAIGALIIGALAASGGGGGGGGVDADPNTFTLNVPELP